MAEKTTYTGNAQAVADALLAELTQTGLYAKTKQDFYDYVLYLLDKHSGNNFFSRNTNAQNERLFKVSDTRIKAAKKNISVKFMDTTEYDEIFKDFVNSFAKTLKENSKILQSEGKTWIMLLENPVIRSVLEQKLKDDCNNAFDIHFNTEKVSIEKKSLIEMFQKEAKKQPDGDFKDALENIAESLSNHKLTPNFEKIFSVIGQTIQTAAAIIPLLPKSA